MHRDRILARRARFIAAALAAAVPAGCARACACLEPAYNPDAHPADAGLTRVRFNTGDLKGETGVLRGKEEVGDLYEIILDSDGTKVSATRDRFDIIPSSQ